MPQLAPAVRVLHMNEWRRADLLRAVVAFFCVSSTALAALSTSAPHHEVVLRHFAT